MLQSPNGIGRCDDDDKIAAMSTQVGPTGAEILVTSLAAAGVDTIFGLPGLQLDYIFDALYDRQDAIRVIHTRHEQATAYMAFGYAQASGRVGTCLVVPGPGVLNATAALSTAYACNAPVLCITGQIPSAHIGGGPRFPARNSGSDRLARFSLEMAGPGEIAGRRRERRAGGFSRVEQRPPPSGGD